MTRKNTRFPGFQHAAGWRRLALVSALICTGLAGPAKALVGAGDAPDGYEAASLPSVQTLYGNGIEFGIYRDGKPVGWHRVSFEAQGDGLRVRTDVEIKVGALFVTLYKFAYESDALWRDGKLVSLRARTDRNGDVALVEADADGGILTVRGPDGSATAPVGLYPTNHWNAGVTGADKILNTITGRISDVALVPAGRERVETAHGTIEATRYRYEGAIENEVWYDAAGRWVGMRFPGDDGSAITLKCRKCLPAKLADASPR